MIFDSTTLQAEESSSLEVALSLAQASQLAYKEQATIIKHCHNWGFDSCHVFNSGSTQGFIAFNDNTILLSFRGTDALADWLINLNILGQDRPYGRVHRGFFNGFTRVADQIAPILSSQAPDKHFWITGHSLGGALATIAGAEFHPQFPPSGIYTFGQPKTGNQAFRQFYEERYPNKFYRFVNNSDIVARIPPTFSHVKQLFWFDKFGQLNEDAPSGLEIEFNGEEAPPPDLTQTEFEQLQQELQELQADAEMFEGAFNIAGFIPGVSDHDLKRYITNIRNSIGHTEVDNYISHSAAVYIEDSAMPPMSDDEAEALSIDIPVLIRTNSVNWSQPDDLKVQSRMGNFITAKASRKQIEQLRKDKNVLSIDASREDGQYESDQSLPFIRANTIHMPPFNEQGDSAIVAIIDSGIDILHETFLDENGQTRILAVWHQRATHGDTPNRINANYSQDYGTLYTKETIQDFIRNPANVPLALRDRKQHGTHVASIAAGRAIGPFNGGVAPQAKLIVVIPNMQTDPNDPRSLGYSVSHADALAFIRSAAQEEGLPVVVNVSLGMNAGAHDGSSLLEAFFDNFSGMGRDPGFVIVKSAGNERGHAGHAFVQVATNAISQISWDSQPVPRSKDYIELWYSSFDDIQFTLIDPAGNRSQTVSATNTKARGLLGGNFCELSLTTFHKDNGDNRLVITILRDMDDIQAGEWTLELEGIDIMEGDVHAWVERNNARAVNFTIGDNDAMTLSIPGTAKTVITVGASHDSLPLRPTDTSSLGPTRDGRPKPDICAPGQEIKAALANSPVFDAIIAKTGTSMAAPHVAGAIALLLSRLHKDSNKDQVNANQIRRALVRSTQNFNGRHHHGFGFGILDVQKFIDLF